MTSKLLAHVAAVQAQCAEYIEPKTTLSPAIAPNGPKAKRRPKSNAAAPS
jgi:hypothetical protein